MTITVRLRCQSVAPALNGDGRLECSLDDHHKGPHDHSVWSVPLPDGWETEWKWTRRTPHISESWWPCPPDEYDRRAKAARGEDVV